MEELKFASFSSGSNGNCYFLRYGKDGILIDAGISLRRLKQYMQGVGLSLDAFSSILVTHDHLDHIRNIGSYCKRLCKPVYATPHVHDALSRHTFAIPYISSCRKDMNIGEWVNISGFLVRSFEVPHDATQTVGYAIMAGESKFVIMTDIGRMTDEALDFAAQADTVVIESNYDTDMLMKGPYPEELKRRISQGNGHLSNAECAEAITKFYHKGLRNLFLCHLSEHNNTPRLAYDNASAALASIGVKPGEVNLRALPRLQPSPFFNL